MKKPSALRRALLVIGLSLASVSIPWHELAAVVSDTDTQTVTALGNGATTNYTIGFTFQDNDHVKVYRQDESTTPYTRTEILQGAGASKFTISGGDPGTTVVMGTAPTSTQRLIIKRETPKTQTVDYVETDAFPAEDHEEAIDKMVLLLQEIDAKVESKVGLADVSTATAPDIPDPVANRFLVYNNGATNLTLAPSGAGSISSGNILRFDGSAWSLFDLDAVLLSGLPPLPSAQIFVGNGSNVATAVSVSGDIAISNAGVTSIGTGVIENADVSASAGIARSKLANGTADHVVINSGAGAFSSEAQLAVSRGGTGLSSPGASGNVLTSNGTAWVSQARTAPTVQKFTSGSGTYTTPSNPAPLYIRVRMIGGGGGGGKSGSNGTAGGGGAGGYIEAIITNPAASYSYAVGAGGAGGTSTSGSNGGDTTFGTNTAAGGEGGGDGANGQGGSGGIATLNLGVGFAIRGSGGTSVTNASAAGTAGGSGGVGPFGGGARGGNGTNNAGGAGQTNSGSGGNGGASTAGDGGAGADGLIIVEEFYQ